MPLKVLPEFECSCDKCKNMCTRPCWGTPEEIQKLIDSGYGDRLGVDYYTDRMVEYEVIAPSLKGYERKQIPDYPRTVKGCTFWTKDGLCELHTLGLKPIGGRTAIHPDLDTNLDYEITKDLAKMWQEEVGKKILETYSDIKRKPYNPIDAGIQEMIYYREKLKITEKLELEKKDEKKYV